MTGRNRIEKPFSIVTVSEANETFEKNLVHLINLLYLVNVKYSSVPYRSARIYFI